MSKYSTLLSDIATSFTHTLDKTFQRQELKQEWPWENILWSGDNIQWAHLEKYYHPKASILHLVIMPNINVPAPIYGFDLIELGGNLTGLFLDMTPTVGEPHKFMDYEFKNPRPIPDWADFFSPYFVCCKPELNEIPHSVSTLGYYMSVLNDTKENDYVIAECEQSQKGYIVGQRRNPQTRRMLTAHCGELLSNRFIDEVLFPQR